MQIQEDKNQKDMKQAEEQTKYEEKKGEEELQETPFFKQVLMTASELILNRFRVLKLLNQAYKKLTDPGNGKSLREEVLYKIKLFLRMTKSIVTLEYKEFPVESLVKVVAAIIYFVMLADLIPDFIPFLGFSDDALIIAWVYNSVRKDLDAYEEWERTSAVEYSEFEAGWSSLKNKLI